MYYACTMHRVFLTAVNSLEVDLLFVLITFCPSACEPFAVGFLHYQGKGKRRRRKTKQKQNILFVL